MTAVVFFRSLFGSFAVFPVSLDAKSSFGYRRYGINQRVDASLNILSKASQGGFLCLMWGVEVKD